jgi:hypothetical protein
MRTTAAVQPAGRLHPVGRTRLAAPGWPPGAGDSFSIAYSGETRVE